MFILKGWLFINPIANESYFGFVKCVCKPSSMDIAAYITARNTKMESGLKILLKTILSSFQTCFIGMVLQSGGFF